MSMNIMGYGRPSATACCTIAKASWPWNADSISKPASRKAPPRPKDPRPSTRALRVRPRPVENLAEIVMNRPVVIHNKDAQISLTPGYVMPGGSPVAKEAQDEGRP